MSYIGQLNNKSQNYFYGIIYELYDSFLNIIINNYDKDSDQSRYEDPFIGRMSGRMSGRYYLIHDGNGRLNYLTFK